MKRLFLSFALIIAFISTYAQAPAPAPGLPIDPDTKKVTYWEVVDVAGATKDDLFKRAKNFGTVEKDNILKDEPETGTYSTKGKFLVIYQSPMKGMNHKGWVEYVLTISAKDGKYKYVMSDLVHKSDKGNGGELSRDIPECGKYTLTLAGWAEVKKKSDVEARKIIEGLKTGMRNPSKASATSTDW